MKPIPGFIEKIVQFHETLKVRFGVMLVGPTMAGKTTCLNTLRESYIKLFQTYKEEKNVVDHPDYQNIE